MVSIPRSGTFEKPSVHHMSSHHFVKEQQEPALLILDANGIELDSLSGLLEWVPTVVVTQESVEKVLSLGIKLDVILAPSPEDSALEELLESQFPIKILGSSHLSYLEAGMDYLIQSGQRAVNLIGWDHRDMEPVEKYLDQLDVVIYDRPIRYFPVKNGSLKKWLTPGSIQLHGAEGSFIEIQTPSTSQIVQIQYATFFDVEEGTHTFKGNGIFWIGEFLE